MSESCLVCDEITGDVAMSGGHLQSDRHVVAFHAPVVAPATDVFADLDDDEAGAVADELRQRDAELRAR